MKKPLLMLSMLGMATLGQAQIQVTSDTSATNLANALVGTGTNVQNAVLTCGAGGAGVYSNGLTTNLGMDNGIVLTSGIVDSIPSSAVFFLSTVTGAPGDNDLTTISAYPTYDACVLEFDVTVAGNTLLMDYVFASEEYEEFVCSGFNDAFAFFISGPNPGGGTYTNENIALVPNSTTPVSINTINNSTMGGANCITTNAAYYIDNQTGTSIAFDGFTMPLTATIPTVPGQTYHMRYAVSDASDMILDTGVFLQGGSLKSPSSTSIADVKPGQLAAVYPNPSNGKVNIYNKDKTSLSIDVYNVIGQNVLQQSVASGASTTLNLGAFGNGVYIVNVSNGTTVETQRVQVTQ